MQNVGDLGDLRVFSVISAFFGFEDRQPRDLAIFTGGRRNRTARIAFRPGGRGRGMSDVVQTNPIGPTDAVLPGLRPEAKTLPPRITLITRIRDLGFSSSIRVMRALRCFYEEAEPGILRWQAGSGIFREAQGPVVPARMVCRTKSRGRVGQCRNCISECQVRRKPGTESP